MGNLIAGTSTSENKVFDAKRAIDDFLGGRDFTDYLRSTELFAENRSPKNPISDLLNGPSTLSTDDLPSFRKNGNVVTLSGDDSVESIRPFSKGDPIGYFNPSAIPDGATNVGPITMVNKDGTIKGGWTYALNGSVTNTIITYDGGESSPNSLLRDRSIAPIDVGTLTAPYPVSSSDSELFQQVNFVANNKESNNATYSQTAGGGVIGSWDTYYRVQYKTAIGEIALNGVAAVRAARLAEDLPAARAAAYAASQGRIDARQATRLKQSWGGGIVSAGIDRSFTPPEYEAKYKQPNPFDTYEIMAEKSGASRGSLNKLVLFGKVAGPAATLFGAYSAYRAVSDAPVDMKGQVTAQETGGFLGGAAGSTLGTGLAAAAVIGGAALFSIAAAPALIIGAGLLGGIALGYGGAEGGRWVGGKIYKWFQ